MDPRIIQTFGPRFVVDDVTELELVTDLLAISEDHLNVVFAVASYLERVPNGSRNFRPILRKRLQNSLNQLPRTPSSLAAHPTPPSA